MAPYSMVLKHTPFHVMHNSSFLPCPGIHVPVAFPKSKCFFTAYPERKVLALRGGAAVKLSGPSTPFPRRGRCGLGHMMPLINSGKVRRIIPISSAASKKNLCPTTSKPRWWWRTLACLPYLVPLREVLAAAEEVFVIYPFLENFNLFDPFLVMWLMLPGWVFLGLAFLIHIVVKMKELPHFLRFHIVMAMLMFNVFQVLRLVCMWVPGVTLKGRMSYLWMSLTFAGMLLVLVGMQCSLCGKYEDVPFITDAALMNLDL